MGVISVQTRGTMCPDGATDLNNWNSAISPVYASFLPFCWSSSNHSFHFWEIFFFFFWFATSLDWPLSSTKCSTLCDCSRIVACSEKESLTHKIRWKASIYGSLKTSLGSFSRCSLKCQWSLSPCSSSSLETQFAPYHLTRDVCRHRLLSVNTHLTVCLHVSASPLYLSPVHFLSVPCPQRGRVETSFCYITMAGQELTM